MAGAGGGVQCKASLKHVELHHGTIIHGLEGFKRGYIWSPIMSRGTRFSDDQRKDFPGSGLSISEHFLTICPVQQYLWKIS